MRKKILFISAFPPCEKTAGQDYSRRLINDLVSKGYGVDLIYAEYPGHEPEIFDSVKVIDVIHPGLINCLKHLKYHPFFIKRFDKGILEHIKKIKDEYDMLYFDFTQVMIYSVYLTHQCKVLMSHDIIFQRYSRKSGLFQLIKPLNVAWIKLGEFEILKSGKHVMTFSNKDSDLISEEYNLGSTPVNFFLKRTGFSYEGIKVDESTFCFYGAWNRHENIEALEWFINRVYPRLKVRRRFLVIGGGMSDDIRDKINAYQDFEITGFVNDPVSIIAGCQALIAPIHYGAGVKVKVVDALTSGTPVIGTELAFEGIEDNAENALFYQSEGEDSFLSILDGFPVIEINYKQRASLEFCERYNNNHFSDIISSL